MALQRPLRPISAMKQLFWSFFGLKPIYTKHAPDPNLPADEPIEEERLPYYDPTSFFPAKPGYIFHNRYEAIAKVGWGTCSTVWLARDLQRIWRSERFVTLKIGTCDFKDKNSALHERNVEQRIANALPDHQGFNYVRTCLDSFEEKGPHGTHLCLVYEPLREPIWLFQQRCHLKGDNIMVNFEDPAVLQDFADAQLSHPMPYKSTDGRAVYLSHNNFGSLRSFYILPKITDFGQAQIQQAVGQLNRHPTQPDGYRAPEVILGAGWAYPIDIWSLGVLMWNLIENRDLFSRIRGNGDGYSAAAHLAEMIALLGPPPKKLLDREKEGRRWNFAPALKNPSGTLCTKAYEWYGGPFFDNDGQCNFLHDHLIPRDLTLESTVNFLDGRDKLLFLDFARKMLQWDPDDRKTAKQLLEDPWLSEKSIRGEV
ncbi:predicted protein [Uncinocarpus reesii 1704]|uniref:non-specific serine/threonine protein kinase n=1 Tax=Uncinocarpus reesii (strain UAMH 1704) TaxID=336963 RepID=C4JSX0_UNCRE|nr:uncharacterized protein UREG_05559 [Uncinocarpus reesii 1704]EEP80717.1 predicted protein [Uncinocarpus reesii 1704]